MHHINNNNKKRKGRGKRLKKLPLSFCCWVSRSPEKTIEAYFNNGDFKPTHIALISSFLAVLKKHYFDFELPSIFA
jgi:hypothetical protein